jgi:hypothetical protein
MAGTTLTPEQRSLRGRIGAFALHAQGGTSTRAATTAFLSRFESQVDPDGVLSPEERSRRALLARKAHMSRLALASRARSSKRKDAAEVQSPAASEREGTRDAPAAA